MATGGDPSMRAGGVPAQPPAAQNRDPRIPETSEAGSLPDTQEGRYGGPGNFCREGWGRSMIWAFGFYWRMRSPMIQLLGWRGYLKAIRNCEREVSRV